MKRRFARGLFARSALAVLAAVAGAALFSCEDSMYTGEIARNVPPTIKLTGAPPEGDTTSYSIAFSWVGNDRDGTVVGYEFVIADGNPFGFDPADTTGADKWTGTQRTDSVFKFTADEVDGNITWGGKVYTQYSRTHTFFIRSIDDRGGRSEAAYRSFTARTFAPYVIIESPRNPFPGSSQVMPPIIKFRWRGEDPIDKPWNKQDVDSTRYMLVPYYRTIMEDINANPLAFEEYWKPWYAYDAPGDSGIGTVIGDDEVLSRQYSYVLAIQAKDEAGAVTTVFDAKTNVRVFAILTNAGPVLKVSEPYLGRYNYIGINNRPEAFRLPAGFLFHFSWEADASSYGGEVSSYRYGWDISDLNDPNEWDCEASPFVKSAPAVSFVSGVHTLFIEAVDNNGISTIAQMEVTTFALNMTRNLLWVDDFYSNDLFQQTNYAFPTETEHDTFWYAICMRAQGWSPSLDIFESASRNNGPPDIELLWRYKNVIWSYSSLDEVNAWDNIVRFIPESSITPETQLRFNFLAYYMAAGGHIWSEGKSDRHGGLAAVLYPNRQFYPVNLRCEITGSRMGCDGDTSGVRTISYRDYCVSIIDKVTPTTRLDARMPARRADWDGVRSIYRDTRDAYTLAHPRLPQTIELWDKVKAPGMFFDPMVQGFTYGEIYNPGYWMNITGTKNQACYHPMYRIRTRSTNSAIDYQTIAFWSTKYADVVAPVPDAVGAPSVQCGFPMWFFNRAQVDSLADEIFRAWGISNQ